jgi:hypothetical protein
VGQLGTSLDVLGGVVFFAGFLIPLAAQLSRYRNGTDPQQQVQVRWVLYGVGVAIGVNLLVSLPYFAPGWFPDLVAAGSPYDQFQQAVSSLAVLAVPISFLFAMLFANLFDVDVVITRTLVYGTLSLVVAGCYLLLVTGAGLLVGERTGRRLSRAARQRQAQEALETAQDFTITPTVDGHAVVHRLTGLVTRFRGPAHEVAYHEAMPGFGPAELRRLKVAVHHERHGDGQIIRRFELLGDPSSAERFTIQEAPDDLRVGRMAEFSVQENDRARRLHYYADGRPVAMDQPLAEGLGLLRVDLFRPGGRPQLLGMDGEPSRLPLRAEPLGGDAVALVPTTLPTESAERIVVDSRTGDVLEETFAVRTDDFHFFANIERANFVFARISTETIWKSSAAFLF